MRRTSVPFGNELQRRLAVSGRRAERDSEVWSRQKEGSRAMNWTDERVELLKKLWADGLSASQIAGAARRRHAECRHRQGSPPEPLGTGEAGIERAAAAEGAAERAAPPIARGFTVGNTALKAHAHPAPRRLPQPVPIEDLVVPISLNISLHGAQRPDVQMADRRSRRRRLPLLRPPQLQRPALLRISLPRSPTSRSTTAAASAKPATSQFAASRRGRAE